MMVDTTSKEVNMSEPVVTDGGPWRGPTLEEWLRRFEQITESELRLLDGNR